MTTPDLQAAAMEEVVEKHCRDFPATPEVYRDERWKEDLARRIASFVEKYHYEEKLREEALLRKVFGCGCGGIGCPEHPELDQPFRPSSGAGEKK